MTALEIVTDVLVLGGGPATTWAALAAEDPPAGAASEVTEG